MLIGVKAIKRSRKGRPCDACHRYMLVGTAQLRMYGAGFPQDRPFTVYVHPQWDCIGRHSNPKERERVERELARIPNHQKFLRITRSDVEGSYVQSVAEAEGVIAGEFDDIEHLASGTSVTFTVVEMSQEDYDDMPEFTGW